MIDRAGADDVLQLAVDRGRVPMTIGALLVLDPSHRPAAEAVRSALLRRAGAVPRLGQRLVRTPPGAGRPVWVDVGSAGCADLVDAMAVAPGGLDGADAVPRGLLDATAALATTRLDLDRPLWRARLLLDERGLVAGLAVVAHHVLADGMGGLAVLGALADDERRPEPPGMPSAGSPTPPYRALARDAWARPGAARCAGCPARRAGWAPAPTSSGWVGPGSPTGAACSAARGTGAASRWPWPTCSRVRDPAHAHGASVNDVVVTAVTGALVELLARRGEPIGEVVVSVPVPRGARAMRRPWATPPGWCRCGCPPCPTPRPGSPRWSPSEGGFARRGVVGRRPC